MRTVGVFRITLMRWAVSRLPSSSRQGWQAGCSRPTATGPTATGQEGAYVLGNGQHDTYDNADTVLLEQALTIVEHILDRGRPPVGISWHVDR